MKSNDPNQCMKLGKLKLQFGIIGSNLFDPPINKIQLRSGRVYDKNEASLDFIYI